MATYVLSCELIFEVESPKRELCVSLDPFTEEKQENTDPVDWLLNSMYVSFSSMVEKKNEDHTE